MRILPVLVLICGPAFADGCPEAPDHTAALDKLFLRLSQAPDPFAAKPISDAMWELWLDAPDGPSQAMLDQGMRYRGSFDFINALDRFTALVNYCPFYAEGYNQRAFIHYLREDYAAALPDLDRALDLNPRHVGALSGKALTLLALGRDDAAQEVLRRAVELNPWLNERFLLKSDPGQDL